MSLLSLQRDMRAWLVGDDDDARWRFGSVESSGLAIYRNTYRAQLVACLDDSFERVRAWIGHDAFRHGVATHIDRVPPSSWTLDAYARDFPVTLAMLYPDDAEIAELAWLEMALGEAFVAPDAIPLRADDLADVDWDSVVFRITPTLDLGPLATNAPAIWSALAADEVPPAAETLAEPGAILVWRDGEIARFRAIDRVEWQALVSIRSGSTFAALCADLVVEYGEDAGVVRAGRMLGQWLGDGLIVGVESIRDPA